MSKDDPERPGVGTDGSLTSDHDRDAEEHEGVGTDGSLHGHRPAGGVGVGTDGSLPDEDDPEE